MPESIDIDKLFLRLACETPLPSSKVAERRSAQPSITKPYTRAQARARQQAELSPNPPLQHSSTSAFSKKRDRKPEIDIFIDIGAANSQLPPSQKKLKSNARTPLAVKSDFASHTPLHSPRQPDRPFPFSPSDPLWENIENYDPRPYYMTPPPTPGGASPAPSPSPSSPQHRSTRVARSRRAPSNRLPPPRNGVLYNVLELDNCYATKDQIRNAYRRVAVEHHPDKVAEEQRETATQIMQNLNAAKEVLLDDTRRRAYHLNGKLPWAT